MLRHTVLVVCLEEPSNDVCVVSVCPYSSLGKVVYKVLFWPKNIRGYRCARLPLVILLVLALLQPKERLDVLVLIDLRFSVLVASGDESGSQMRPCRSWMPSEAMDKDNAASSQNTIRLGVRESKDGWKSTELYFRSR